jgi:hypothetical protein
MKKAGFLILCVITWALVLPSFATASEACGELYTYSDMWLADDGNIVADNYTDAEPCGAYYTTFADVTVSMPSGSSYYGSGSGFSSFAEALAEAATSSETSDGQVEVDSFGGVDYSCGDSQSGFSVLWFDFMWANTLIKMKQPKTETNCHTNSLDITECDYDGYYWCTITPMWKPSGVTKVLQIPLSATIWYWQGKALCERPTGTTIPWACIGAALDSPPMSDARLPSADCTPDQ